MQTRIRTSLEKQLFIVSVKVCLVSVVALFVLDIFYFKNYPLAITDAVGLVVFSIFVFLSRKSTQVNRLINPFIVFLLLLVNAGWYFGGGLTTGNALILLLIFYISLVMIERKRRTLLIVVCFINLAVMMSLEFFNMGIRKEFSDMSSRLISSDIFILLTFSTGIFLIAYVKSRYEKLRKLLEQKNSQLLELNQELSSVNENLEDMVRKRTERIKEQNRKIIDYAFMNSHKVRGPLARILGLTELFDQNILRENEIPSSLSAIKSNADELDTQIREINVLLENEEFIEDDYIRS